MEIIIFNVALKCIIVYGILAFKNEIIHSFIEYGFCILINIFLCCV